MLPSGTPICTLHLLPAHLVTSSIFNAMNAASFRKGAGGNVTSPESSPQLGVPQPVRSLSRSSSRSSVGGEGAEEKKRRHLFRRKEVAS